MTMTMHMNTNVKLPRGARGWHLYDLPGAGAAARQMSAALAAAMRAPGATRASVEAAIGPVFAAHRSYGALDSEPLAVLDRILARF